MITFDNVWKKFGRAEILRGIDLAVPAGSAFALLGANGAGKTTLIRTLMNMIEPDRGTVRVLDVDSRRLGPEQLSKIGFVAENQRLPERLTVKEFLDYVRPLYAGWDCGLEQDLMRQLELPPARQIRVLSHGMKMKLRLVAALAFRPRLLVLDEPLSGLDPLVRDEFLEGLLGQAGETTILISSHELHEIEGMATHVAFLDRGKVLFQEPIDDLQARVREVQVTLPAGAEAPAAPPAHWLNIRMSGSVVSFVDTQFSETGLPERLAASFGRVRAVDVHPIGLRPIFTTIARSLRERGI